MSVYHLVILPHAFSFLQYRNSYNSCTHAKYYYADKVNENEVGRTCGTRERRYKVYKILVGKPEGKRPLARPRVDGRMGSERILRRLAEGVYSGLSWLRIGIGVYYVCVGLSL
jgi:hypothetical protein